MNPTKKRAMKLLLLLALVGVTFAASLPEPRQQNALVAQPNHGVQLSDWLADLILQILGITAADLLKLISVTFIGMEDFIVLAVDALKAILADVDGDIANELREIIDQALTTVLAIMEPFQEQLTKVLPAITRERTGARDSVSDIIYSLLGITLEELLTSVTNALGGLQEILESSFKELQEISQQVTPEVATKIQEVNDEMLKDTVVLLMPLINKLNQIFPPEELQKHTPMLA